MKFLFDLFPVLLFFAAFKVYDIYVATAVAIGATFLQIGLLALLKRKIEPMLWRVNFKLFGGTGLMLLFVIGQALYLARHVQEEKPQEDKP